MTCVEFRARLHPYVDGELSVHETVAADAHVAGCGPCGVLGDDERRLHTLLRRQPRDIVPAEFRAALRLRLRREPSRGAKRSWQTVVSAAAAAAAMVAVLVLPTRHDPPVIAELVDKHSAYAQVDQPAELVSSNPADIADWFRQRAALHVTVPDYSPAHIRLVGGRLAEAYERPAAYLFYEKGRTLLSVFTVGLPEAGAGMQGSPISYRGDIYVRYERSGFRAVSWVEGRTLFGLVSRLDYDALLECADTLKAAHARRTPL